MHDPCEFSQQEVITTDGSAQILCMSVRVGIYVTPELRSGTTSALLVKGLACTKQAPSKGQTLWWQSHELALAVDHRVFMDKAFRRGQTFEYPKDS